MSPRRGRGLALLALTLAALAPFAPALLGGKVLFGSDALAIGLPVNLAVRRSLEAGSFPWWLPDLFCGLPGIASFSTDFLHPVTFLLQVLRFPVLSIYGFDMAAQVLLGGLGMLVFARRALGLGWTAAFVSAFSFALSGAQLSPIYAGHSNNVKAIAMIPWAFWGLWEGAGRGKLWGVAVCGAALGLQGLGVGFQIMAYTALSLAGLALWLPAPRPSLRGVAWKLGCLAGAGCLGACLAAPQFLPSLSYKAQSLRQEFSYDMFTSWSFPPAEALTWWVPGFFGWGDAAYWGGWDFTLTTEYLGLLPWVLAAAALAAGWKRPGGSERFWVYLAAGALAAGLGKYFPLHHLFFHLPVFNGFRSWVRCLCLLSFAVSVLAGLGWEALLGGDARARKAALAACGAAAGVALLALLLQDPILRAAAAKSRDLAASRAALSDSALRSLGFALGLGIWAWWLGAGALRRQALAAAAVGLGLGLADESLVARRYLHFQAPAEALRLPTLAPTLQAALRGEPGRVELIGGNNPNRAAVWGFQLAGGYLGLPPARVSHLRDKLQSRADLYFGLSNVRVLGLDQAAQAPWLRPLGAEAGTQFFENLAFLPRARVLTRSRAAKDEDEALALLAGGQMDPRTEAVVEGGPALAGQAPGQARLTRDTGAELTVDASADAPGLLVLSQAWFPGWEASVDGKPAEVLKVNAAFQGVALAPGRHQVELRYRQPYLGPALALFLLGLAAAAALLVLSRRPPLAAAASEGAR